MAFNLNQLIEFWLGLLMQFRDLGPLAPIILVLIESFFPFLPLILIVTFNVSAYGIFWGFLYSYFGNVIGSLLVFFFFRFLKDTTLVERFSHRKSVDIIMHWIIHQHPLFLSFLFTSPFTPSAFINIFFGLSGYSKRLFSLSLIIGKFILMLILVIFGLSLLEITNQPGWLIVSVIIYVIAYFLSQKYGKITGEED